MTADEFEGEGPRPTKIAFAWMGAMALILAAIGWKVAHKPEEAVDEDPDMSDLLPGKLGGPPSPSSGEMSPEPFKHLITPLESELYSAKGYTNMEDISSLLTEIAVQLGNAPSFPAKAASRRAIQLMQTLGPPEETIPRWESFRDSTWSRATWFKKKGAKGEHKPATPEPEE